MADRDGRAVGRGSGTGATLAAPSAPPRELVTGQLSRDVLLRSLPWDGPDAPDWAPLVEREWLVTNGLGGYASGTISGASTRRYHALLVAAHPPPLGRILALVDLIETIHLPGRPPIRLGGEERPDTIELHGARYLSEFRLEWGLPVWTYDVRGAVLERRLAVLHGTNTTVLRYRLLEGPAVRFELRPRVRLRPHDTAVDVPLEPGYHCVEDAGGVRISGVPDFPDLLIRFAGSEGEFAESPRILAEFLYRVEASRGYAAVGDVWSPGVWTGTLNAGAEASVVASTDDPATVPDPATAAGLWEGEVERRRRLLEAAHPAARSGPAAELVLAADQFIIKPVRAHGSEGERERSIIAGYHWFTDWGRDTMISLEGLTLVTGRAREAGSILLAFGDHVRDGLIPNFFPEGENEGVYHTADATLWFFHAVDRYLAYTRDGETLRRLLPQLRSIVDAHLRGTRFGIAVDPADGLLRQGAEGYQLTWMDAKVDNWVVTPRRGKAVEINALWYNALRLMARWEEAAGELARARDLEEHAARARASFNARFWIHGEGYLYDVVDGEDGSSDPSFRPNQILAVALPHAVLDEPRWARVVDAVRARLLTPVGLRSLAPGHPDYRNTYFGNLWARDAAYHQGTVWGWLIGPFVEAWLRVHPDDLHGARAFLDGLLTHLDDFCIGSVGEIFDADAPHHPRGCVAQAWSVAELLRCLVRTAVSRELEHTPRRGRW